MKLGEVLKKQLPFLADLALLGLAFLTSVLAAPLLRLPFRNPYNISNPHNAAAFNPDNNFYSLLFIIVGTLAIWYLLKKLYQGKYDWLIKVLTIGLILAHFFLINALNSPGYIPGPDGFDNFHNGEQLAPTSAYESGKDLYSQIFYLRGAGVDAIIPGLGFKVLGESIGSFLVITDLGEILAILSFLLVLALLIRNSLVFALAATLFYASNAISLMHVRDVAVWAILGLIMLLFRLNLSLLHKRIILGSIGFLSSLMLYISVDRGVLLFVLALILAALLVVTTPDSKNVYKLNLKGWKKNLEAPAWLLGGLVLGLALPGLLLGWHSFTTFLRMTFVEIPAYGGLLVSMPFPSWFGQDHMIWGPVFMAIATGFLLVKLYSSSVKTELNRLLPYTLIFIFGVLSIKIGANRIHITKMASVISPLFFISVFILALAITVAYKNKQARQQLVPAILLCSFVLAFFAQFDFAKLLQQPTYSRAQLANYLRVPKTSDDSWISPQTKQVKSYILKNTKPNDKIFAFTSDPMYYYLTGRENPSRFYVSWFADPQPYTEELLNDLKRNKPALIIYKEGTWMDAPDNIAMSERLPEVNKWIKANYRTQVNVGETVILKP